MTSPGFRRPPPLVLAGPPDPLASRVAAILERHDRLLALELAAVVDELRSRCPEACMDPVFTPAWERLSSLRGGIAKALEEPALEAWIGRAQLLIGSPVLRTCPGQHVPRLLARFSALMLNLAPCEQGGKGTAVVLGGGAVPVLLGAAQIRPPSARRTVVRWTWNGSLRLRDEGGRTLVEMGANGRASELPDGGWEVEVAQALDGVRVFAQPPCVQHPGAPCAPDFPAGFARACKALPSSTRHLLQLSTRAAGPHCGLHPLDARSWLGAGAPPAAAELAHGLAGNLVSRCARVYRFDTSCRLIDALGAREQADLVQAVARELLRDEADAPESLLGRILAACERREPARPPGEASPAPGLILGFQPVLARARIAVADPGLWSEPKNRRPDKAPGWRILDALLDLSRGEIARLRAALAEWPEPEVRHFGLACLDYYEGWFPAGVAHVLACIEADRACEDYWLLLALFSRHLRHFDLFDDIAFGQARTDAVLERARRVSGCSP